MAGKSVYGEGSTDSDAYWFIPSTEYVDREPPLKTSLFDDPERLNASLDAAVRSYDEDFPDEEVIARGTQILRQAGRATGINLDPELLGD
ncbi:MAG TPA: hypothetical protein VLF40_06750 [Candidatus Saccharimonadales bacterium]|nr:hypothetical protein [Candidatus Saccharimonadales bacterium]